jgi:hypothetical protein
MYKNKTTLTSLAAQAFANRTGLNHAKLQHSAMHTQQESLQTNTIKSV